MMLDDDLTANLKKSKIPAWDKEVIKEVYRLMKNKREHNLSSIHTHFKGKHHESQLSMAVAWLQNRHFICIKKIVMTNNDDTRIVSFVMNPVKNYLQSLVKQAIPSHSRVA
jgi:hypothetical protein